MNRDRRENAKTENHPGNGNRSRFRYRAPGGDGKVIVKNIADKLGCSVQPIYSYCSNMEGLKAALTERTGTFMKEYLAAHIEKKDYFRSMGRAQLRFAREEPQLFQLYFLRRRSDIHSLQDLYSKESSREVAKFISDTLQLTMAQAEQLHLHMIIYTMGIASILATSCSHIPEEELMTQLETACDAFLAEMRRKNNE